jgi:hypothetical protein
VNVDIVTDIQRALPAAIVQFGHRVGMPGLRVRLDEQDVYPRDTSFLPYVTISGLALAALVIAGVLGAIAITREIEGRTVALWRASPASPSAVLAGKLAASSSVAAVALAVATGVVVVGYGVVPAHLPAALVGLSVAIVSFACMGICAGAFVRKTLVVVPLIFGLAMPLFIDSGALEPTRFDGETIWWLAHLTPLYWVVGWLEWAFFDLKVTPEPVWLDLGATIALGALAFLVARARIVRAALVARASA